MEMQTLVKLSRKLHVYPIGIYRSQEVFEDRNQLDFEAAPPQCAPFFRISLRSLCLNIFSYNSKYDIIMENSKCTLL